MRETEEKAERRHGMKTKCGLDCEECGFQECPGCTETDGRPFGGSCMLAVCCGEKGCENCGRSFEAPCRLKEELIAEFNALGIEDMEEVKSLNALSGTYVNLAYKLPGGQEIRFWDDARVYLGRQQNLSGESDSQDGQRQVLWPCSGRGLPAGKRIWGGRFGRRNRCL